jgi:hypothetical protein
MMPKSLNSGVKRSNVEASIATKWLVIKCFLGNEYAYNSRGTGGEMFSNQTSTKLYKDSQ